MGTSELVLAPFEPREVYYTVENNPLEFLLISGNSSADTGQEPPEVYNWKIFSVI